MKKIAIILTLSIAGFFALGGRTLLQDPVATIEAFAVRHADLLPLEMLGESLFDKHCASCHDNPEMHAPTRQSLAGFSKESMMIAMEFGKMQPMAAHMSKQERGLITMYLSGSDTQSYAWLDATRCDKSVRDGIASGDKEQYVANWGLGKNNQRFASKQTAGITKSNVATLELAWSFAFPKVTDMRSQPVIIGDTMYVGDKAKKLYAIDRKSGCVLREADFIAGVRSSITLAATLDKGGEGKPLLVFADSLATVYAVDPMTFEVVWQTQTKLFEKSVITGNISYDNNKLFVPISSYEVAVTSSSSYVCCRSHGGVIALDATNGEQLWQWHSTKDATLQGLNAEGLEQYGPSGASVWTTPTVDEKRGRIYIGTGQNLSNPATNSSDSIFALEIDTGKLAWHFQATKDDVWNAACWGDGANCPEDAGGDVDFGASVILTQLLDGSDILLAGQKSGEVYGLNPDPKGAQGELIWKNRVSQGTTNGGIHWGMAASGQRLIVPVSDPERERPGYTAKPGLYALDIANGDLLWSKPVERQCEFDEQYRPASGLEAMRSSKSQSLKDQYACSFYYGLSSAATVTPELAFSAGLDGVIRAYDIENGDIVWQAETAKHFQASNGIEGHGGAIDVAGQVLAHGWLYVFSGYSMFGQLPGNMLLAFKVK